MLSDVNFEDCYRFEATCPFKDCPDFQQQTIFSSPQEYQRHHCTKHEQRGNFKWKCPGCPKQNSSFYNFSAHVTGHRDLCSPPWICTLLPFKKIHLKIHHSDKETQHNHKIGICGKRSSTKNNLISHIKSVHKLNPLTYTKFNNKTFYNKKDRKLISSNRKRKRLKHETDENVSNTQYIHPESIEPKPKRIHIDNDYNQLMYLNKKLIASCLNQQNGFKSYDDLVYGVKEYKRLISEINMNRIVNPNAFATKHHHDVSEMNHGLNQLRHLFTKGPIIGVCQINENVDNDHNNDNDK